MAGTRGTITDRILAQLGGAGLLEKIRDLPMADFHSFLLELYHQRADGVSPAGLVKAFQSNRFSVPSELDPVAYHAFEADLLALAQRQGMEAVLLSPVAPFASCAAFGCVDQNKVVSAARGTEVLADPTNMLAVIIARLLKEKKADNRVPLHYCTTARVLRAQPFPNRKGYYSHFGIFCIVSSGKDTGSYACEKNMLAKQLTYYQNLLVKQYNAKLSIMIRKNHGYADGGGFLERMAAMVLDTFPGVPVSTDMEYEDSHYYRGMHYKLFMDKENERVEIGDGGFVDWPRQMTGNPKERMLISGIGMDRLLI